MVFETSVSFIHLTRLIDLYHIPDDEDQDLKRGGVMLC
jgi:hypothetical protein